MKFLTPDLSDKRIGYATDYLENKGFIKVDKEENADFILLGVNPDKKYLEYRKPIFAGNIKNEKVFDYTKDEGFALKNAYLTAEGAISLAISETEKSLSNSSVLIVGYGRIAKAIEYYLSNLTSEVTVCARNENARINAKYRNSNAVDFSDLKNNLRYDIIFNTVPHPVINSSELSAAKRDTLIIDLASFPGGVDRHFAEIKGIKLITARGLPSKFSPKTAGKIVGETVYNHIREVKA